MRHDSLEKWRRTYLVSVGVILAIVALAKLFSATGTSDILAHNDPILGLPFRSVIIGVGLLELLIAAMCFTGRQTQLTLWAIAWLAANFSVYRAGLWFMGWKRPCGCLGNLTDALHISPSTAEWTTKVILGYLLVGSCVVLGFNNLDRGKSCSAS